MGTRYFGQRIKRNEDPRLLTGQALFVDDVNLPGMLHAAFLRSPFAHARIRSIDTSRAAEMPGVVAVYAAEDLGDYWRRGPLNVSKPPIERSIFYERTHPILVRKKVRHSGEAVAVVVAENRYLAEDAVNEILVDYEPLDAVVGLEEALEPESPLVHDDLDSNLAAQVIQEKGSYEKAKSEAYLILKRRFSYDRGTAAAIENRGVVASWDHRSGRLTVWDTTQAPIPIRNGLAGMLGLSENQIRVIAPFIGGGFGPKILMFYPEEMLIPWIALRLGQPVKWIEDRTENFYATTQERLQIHEAEIALSKDGMILGVRDNFLHDTGAYDTYGLTVPINTQCTLLGPYDIPNYYSEFKVVFTNKPIVTPYRGAGRQHGVFVIERFLDFASRELDISIPEIRRRNFIPPDKFPYDNEIIFQDFTNLQYDSGNYEPSLDDALSLIKYEQFVSDEQPKLRKQGKYVGIGIAAYVEGTGIGPYEGARVQVQASGKVAVVTGVGTQGQGHFTSFAQVVAEQLGVEVSDVDVVTGDTDQFHWGTGTFASRGAVVAGNAINEAAKDVRKKILRLASDMFEAAEEDLELVDGQVRVKGVPERSIPLGDLAREANPLRGAVKPGAEPGLEATNYFGPSRGATANGVHAILVEVDPETFDVKVLKYVVVHDCGEVINPLILDGQVHGGVAQGLGNAFYEQLAFDEYGQLLNASFMDYLLPTSLQVPPIEVGHVTTPSPLNPMGVKGAGEAGAIPVAALFTQAIENALQISNFEILEIPLSPHRLWELVREGIFKLIVLNLQRISQAAQSWLQSDKSARVLQVFPRVCNLIDQEGDVISLQLSKMDMGPFSAELSDLPGTADSEGFHAHLSPKSEVRVTQNKLILSPLVIKTTTGENWEARLPIGPEHNNQATLDLIDRIEAQLTLEAPVESMPSDLSPASGTPPNRSVSQIGSSIARAAVDRASLYAQEILTGIANENLERAMQGARKIAGLGGGLTPAGDDYLLGVIYALWHNWPEVTAEQWAHKMAGTAIPQTTPLSAAWLRAGTRKEAGEHWHRLFEGWHTRKQKLFAAALQEIIRTGHTSGADALAGFCSATRVTLECLS